MVVFVLSCWCELVWQYNLYISIYLIHCSCCICVTNISTKKQLSQLLLSVPPHTPQISSIFAQNMLQNISSLPITLFVCLFVFLSFLLSLYKVYPRLFVKIIPSIPLLKQQNWINSKWIYPINFIIIKNYKFVAFQRWSKH